MKQNFDLSEIEQIKAECTFHDEVFDANQKMVYEF